MFVNSITDKSFFGILIFNDSFDIIFKNKKAEELLSCGIIIKYVKEKVSQGHATSYGTLLNDEEDELACYIENDGNWHYALICRCRDLSGIIKESNEYRDLEKEYRVVLDHIDDGVVVMDGAGRYIRVNKAIRGDVEEKHYIGKKSEDLVKMGFMSESIVQEIIKYGTKRSMLLKIVDSPDMLVTEIPYYENNQLKLIVSCERNMSELRILEGQLLEKSCLCEDLQNGNSIISIYGKECNLPVIAESKVTKKLLELTQRVAKTNSTLLFQGESGVGKEIFVNMAYLYSQRKDKPFIKINCGAIPEALLESELFGYVPGAFTGADKNGKAGYFEVANGGTLFLDEVSEIPIGLQVKLLRVIQEQEVTRIGSTIPIKLDVRLMIASNKDLKKEVEKGNFRLDLFYRISVIMLEIPPLRDRGDDIKALTCYFLNKYNKKNNSSKTILESAITILESYNWPGNVRELENLIERLVAITIHEEINDYDIWEALREEKVRLSNPVDPIRNEEIISVIDYEKDLLSRLMEEYNNDTVKVSAELNISRSTVNRKLKKYGLR